MLPKKDPSTPYKFFIKLIPQKIVLPNTFIVEYYSLKPVNYETIIP